MQQLEQLSIISSLANSICLKIEFDKNSSEMKSHQIKESSPKDNSFFSLGLDKIHDHCVTPLAKPLQTPVGNYTLKAGVKYNIDDGPSSGNEKLNKFILLDDMFSRKWLQIHVCKV